MIPSSVREEVRARVELADLVGQYVPLRRAGHSLVARCPFHEEKSPSFHVSPDRGLFHCFGCKASGDVFTFYERIEGVTFPEALRALAARAGVEIPEEPRDPARVAEEKRAKELTERLYFACEVAAEFFERALETAELAPLARDEVARRGVTPEVASRFRLGYAPASWDGLTDYLKKRGVSPADAELAGLLLPRKTGTGYYDRFRHRLMFPVWDRHGKVVAFSGRVLPITEDMPEGLVPADAGKYINSPETPIYKKSDLLFGLQIARTAMRQSAEAVLVEGNFDVVAMHQHGFANTICPLGTAFTETQAKLLRRFAEVVTLVFDADEAGRKAARNAQGVCAKVGLIARVAVLPPDRGKDPDEILRAEGGADFLRAQIERAPAIVEWLIDDTAAHCADNTPARIAALRALAPIVARVADPLERTAYVERVMQGLHFMDKQAVWAAVREAEQAERHAQHNPFRPPPPRPSARPPRDEPFRRAHDGDTPNAEKRGDSVSTVTAEVVDALLRSPALLASEEVETLLPLLNPAFAQPLVAEARTQWLSRGGLDGAALLALAPTDKARAWLSERLIPGAGEPDPARDERDRQALMDCVARLQALRDRENAKRLRQESAKAQAAGDEERAARLARQAQLIDKQRQGTAANRNRGAA